MVHNRTFPRGFQLVGAFPNYFLDAHAVLWSPSGRCHITRELAGKRAEMQINAVFGLLANMRRLSLLAVAKPHVAGQNRKRKSDYACPMCYRVPHNELDETKHAKATASRARSPAAKRKVSEDSGSVPVGVRL